MPEINLLPEDKRLAEDKERRKKSGKIEEVELTNPPRLLEPGQRDNKGWGIAWRNFVNRLKGTRFLEPKEIEVVKPVAESYADVLRRERQNVKPAAMVQKNGKLPEVKLIEEAKPRLSFWQRRKLLKEEKKRKDEMLKRTKVAEEKPFIVKKEIKPEKKNIGLYKKVFDQPLPPTEPVKQYSPSKTSAKAESMIIIKKKGPKKYGLTSPPTEGVKEGLEVNLLPQQMEVKEVTVGQLIMILAKTALITGIIVGLVYLGLHWYLAGIRDKIDGYNSEIIKTGENIVNLEDKTAEALRLQKRMGLVEELLAQHVHWSNFFDFLEDNIIDEVYFIDFQGEEAGRIVLTGIANDFTTVGQQLKIFEEAEDYIQRASVDIVQVQRTDVSAGREGVYFNLYLFFKPNKFLKN